MQEGEEEIGQLGISFSDTDEGLGMRHIQEMFSPVLYRCSKSVMKSTEL